MSVESAFFANQLYKVFGLKIVHETLVITKYSNYDSENSSFNSDELEKSVFDEVIDDSTETNLNRLGYQNRVYFYIFIRNIEFCKFCLTTLPGCVVEQ